MDLVVCDRVCVFVDGCLGMGGVALGRYATAISAGRHKKTGLSDQYLRQNRSTCKGFCRFIELLSATTTTPNPQEALDGHFSMFAMPSTHRPKDHVTPMPPHCYGDVGHTGACDDVGPVPVGWPRRQLS